jgi:preprotein translocase subunit SecD
MLIEFTKEAAEEFVEVVERLAESIRLAPGATALYPGYLSIGVEGETSAPLRVPYFELGLFAEIGQIVPLGGDPNIQRVEGTNSFTVSLAGAVGGGAIADMAAAEERFGGSPVLSFREELGKVDEDVGLTGDDLARAYASQRSGTGLPIINVEFNSEGTRKFAELTSQIAGTPDVLAIFLDDEELLAPSVQQAIRGGSAFIEGRDFTFERVRDISLLLESGRLPVPIELIRERDVDAILGADSLARSVAAGLVGLGLVLLFMVVYYRAPGVVAAVALIIYASLVLSVFKLFPVTLELSGVAAAILSIGMAVDANILIFERMKEELRAGRTLLSSVNIGFNRAWPAIRDSNVSTLITCAILFWFADTLDASIVQGFAFTLAIGVGLSMFSAITVSRTFLRILATTRLSRRLGLFIPSGAGDLPQQQPRHGAV